MILVRLKSNSNPEIILEGSESEIVKEIHKRNLEDWHDAYFYERDKFENLGLSKEIYDYYTICENKKEFKNLIMKNKKVKVNIEGHDGCDKRFTMNFPYMEVFVDYDDVAHSEVDAASKVIKKIVEDHWDEDLFKKELKKVLLENWEKNEFGMQRDYDSLKDYLSQNGIF